MFEPLQLNKILAELGDMRRRGANARNDCTAGEQMNIAARHISAAIAAIEAAALMYDIDCSIWSTLREDGRLAARNGTPWYKNPHLSGSWEAYQWDIGCTEYCRIKWGVR